MLVLDWMLFLTCIATLFNCFRARKKAEQATTARIKTPPSSDNEGAPPPQPTPSSSSKKASMKKVRRDRAKVYRDKVTLEEKLKAAVRLAQKYKKRLQRLRSKKELTPYRYQS